jgi:hypothetical protein
MSWRICGSIMLGKGPSDLEGSGLGESFLLCIFLVERDVGDKITGEFGKAVYVLRECTIRLASHRLYASESTP